MPCQVSLRRVRRPGPGSAGLCWQLLTPCSHPAAFAQGSSPGLSFTDRKSAKIPSSVALPRLWAEHGGFHCLLSAQKGSLRAPGAHPYPHQNPHQKGRQPLALVVPILMAEGRAQAAIPRLKLLTFSTAFPWRAAFQGSPHALHPPASPAPWHWGGFQQHKGSAVNVKINVNVNPGSHEHRIHPSSAKASSSSSFSPTLRGLQEMEVGSADG